MLFSVIPTAQYPASPTTCGLFPNSIKNLHLTTLSLCLVWTEQMPNCSMFELLYVLRVAELIS